MTHLTARLWETVSIPCLTANRSRRAALHTAKKKGHSMKTGNFWSYTIGAASLAALLILSGCTGRDAAGTTPSPAAEADRSPAAESVGTAPQSPAAAPETESPDPVEELMAAMSLEEKIGQLFIIRPESVCEELTPQQAHETDEYGVTAWTGAMTEKLERYPAGGFALFGKNISDPDQLSAFIAAMEQASPLPPLIGVDEEGGVVSRLANNPNFQLPQYESMAAIGSGGDTDAARALGLTIGGYLREYGFNLDFAPVADVNSNPENIVIGERSFGSDPYLVSQMVGAELEGLHEAGILGCIKHFPGHGDTAGDTHEGYVSISKTWEELKLTELIPFADNLAAADMVMIAHISLPNVTSDGLPASLSEELVSGRLRGELGYEGVIISDSLAMSAITQNFSSGEAALLALNAGVDILLMPEDYTAAFEALIQAVEDGRLSTERIDESLRRVLELKLSCGLL